MRICPFAIIFAAQTVYSTPVRWEISEGGNGHFYEAVLIGEHITWEAAQAAAKSRGENRHLATITSAEENAFVESLISDHRQSQWYEEGP